MWIIKLCKPNRLLRKTVFWAALTLLCCVLFGCGASDASAKKAAEEAAIAMEDENTYVYYLNKEETGIGEQECALPEGGTEAQVDALITALGSDPDSASLHRDLGNDVTLLDHTLNEDQVILDFAQDYRDLEKSREVLLRACFVRTLCQVDGVETVSFLVEGEPLQDSAGRPVGPMSADSFFENKGDEINAYEKAHLTLYFASEDGTRLVQESRDVIYSGNISLEKLVLENLLEGPRSTRLQSTLSQERELISVSVKDSICYVNLSGTVVDWTGNVTEEVSLYSIVNSLTELPGVNKVEISIDGATDRCFRESLPLDVMYTRNLDLVD